MARLADQVRDERQARVVLSMIAEPDDPVTGRLLNQVGSVETLRLIEDDQAAVPGRTVWTRSLGASTCRQRSRLIWRIGWRSSRTAGSAH